MIAVRMSIRQIKISSMRGLDNHNINNNDNNSNNRNDKCGNDNDNNIRLPESPRGSQMHAAYRRATCRVSVSFHLQSSRRDFKRASHFVEP